MIDRHDCNASRVAKPGARAAVFCARAAVRCALAAIRLYQLTLSPYLGRQCRFYPSCSHYAMEAIEAHGLVRGAGLSLRRLGRCHPFHPGGVDLVPADASGPVARSRTADARVCREES